MAFISATRTGTNWNSQPISQTRPAGATTGRILITVCFAYSQTSANTFTTPTGHTPVPGCSYSNGFDISVAAFYRVVQAGDGTTDTLQCSNPTTGWVLQLVYDTTTTVSASNGQHNAASTSVVAPSLTAATGDTLVCVFVGQESSQSPFSTATGMTERIDNADATNGGSVASDDQTIAAGGATGTRTSTGSASQPSFGISIVLTNGGTTAPTADSNTYARRPRPGRGPYSLGRYYRPIGEMGAALRSSQVLSDAIAETVTATDTQTAQAAFGSAVAESVAAADSQTASLVTTGAAAESVSAADSQTATFAAGGASAETLSATDTSTAAAAFQSSQSETATPSDTASAGAAFSAAISESASPADTTTGSVAGTSSAVAETATPADTATARAAFAAAVAEFGSAIDSAAYLGGNSAAVSEAVSGVDSASAQAAFAGGVSEGGTLVDAASALAALHADMAESAFISEATAAFHAFTAALAELASATDAMSAVVSILTSIAAARLYVERIESRIYAERSESRINVEPPL